MAKFEGQERRMPGINACLKEYGMNTLEDARDLTLEHGINVEEIVKGVQPIAFDNAVWAYTLGTALALKKGAKSAAEASEMIGVVFRSVMKPPAIESAVQTTPPMTNAATIPPGPFRPTATITTDASISVISVMPDTGFVPTMAMALAATVVKRNDMPATNRIATNVCSRLPCITSK